MLSTTYLAESRCGSKDVERAVVKHLQGAWAQPHPCWRKPYLREFRRIVAEMPRKSCARIMHATDEDSLESSNIQP